MDQYLAICCKYVLSKQGKKSDTYTFKLHTKYINKTKHTQFLPVCILMADAEDASVFELHTEVE